ncbi:shikimate kinase [Limisalsivibrio acetivorans]|uniref:shikimate kinase n=1 Tax=Limisalsivibrio acetivorans TaxID=1304888 RepID=UPI0003B2EC20|nr:shikimate kinase [Limisalsivibrio acetivorans]
MRKNIYLIGFMGTGKSTVGRILAEKLDMEFCDTDSMIEMKTGKTVEEIFEDESEEVFRNIESEVLTEITSRKNLVVSTGGGIVVTRGNMDMMRKEGLLVSLLASADVIFERTKNDKCRPLLNVEDPLDQIKKMLFDRAHFYIDTDFLVDTTDTPPEEAAEQIVEFYNNADSQG